MIVHAVAAVPVVTSPVTSFEFTVNVGDPVPHEETVGALGVLEAVRWPYWSTWKSVPGVLVPSIWNIGLLFVEEAVLTTKSCVPNLSCITKAFGEEVAITSDDHIVELAEVKEANPAVLPTDSRNPGVVLPTPMFCARETKIDEVAVRAVPFDA